MRTGHLIATVSAMLTACASSSTAPTPAVPVPITRIGDRFGGLEAPATLVVRDRDMWQSIWIQIHRGGFAPPLPEVNFSTDMIVVVALGAKPTSGYAVTVTAASETGRVVTVETDSVSPGPNCVTLQVITYPTDVVRMPRRDGEVGFRITPKVTSCM